MEFNRLQICQFSGTVLNGLEVEIIKCGYLVQSENKKELDFPVPMGSKLETSYHRAVCDAT